VHKGIISAVKRVKYASDRMSYIILKGHWGHIIVMNVNAPKGDKIYDVRNSFYKEMERLLTNSLKTT
jgi:hypothetical protein